MEESIRRCLERVVRLVWPLRRLPPEDAPMTVRPLAPNPPRSVGAGFPPSRYRSGGTSRGTDIARVRPYFVAFEEERERQRQRERRRALLLALDGVDVGPEWIHGVEIGGVR